MRWFDKRYHTLNYELQKEFDQKVIKLSLSGGFTCPNRDGRIGKKGCLFCSEEGSGEFAAPENLDILKQIEQQKEFLSPKWKTGKYVAYFQSFTNTYAPVEILREKFYKAISAPEVVGLAIATRPDCLPVEVLDLLEELKDKTYLWVELGLQTIHEKTAKLIRRGYDLKVFENAVNELNRRGINVVAHLIVGLPGESREDILQSAKYVGHMDIQGVKLHLLHVLKGTDLHKYYLESNFKLLSKEEYISLIADIIEILPPEIVIHRITGDGAKELLIGPRWSLNKLSVITGIDMELKRRDSYQGKFYNKQM